MSTTRLELEIASNASDAERALNSLISALERVRRAVSTSTSPDFARNMRAFGTAVANAVSSETVRNYERLAEAMRTIGSHSSSLSRVRSAASSAGDLPSVSNSSVRDVASRSVSDVAISRSARDAAERTKTYTNRLKELFSESRRGTRHMNTLAASFARIARNMAIRAVIKEIAKGFKEGFDNVYQYAKVVGHELAPAVDSAKDALFKMKNSIGAALAPAVQTLIPYVVQLVHWFINLVNIVNQFLALLRGQSTWLRATDAAASTLDKVKDSAKGASASVKELKGLLADWDELNIIQQEVGGGGSGSGSKADDDAEKYALLFEEVSTFDNKVKDLVSKVRALAEQAKEVLGWIKESFNKVKDIAATVSDILQGWGVSKELSDVVGWIVGGVVLPLQLTFDITTKFDEKFLNSGDPGFLLLSLLTSAFGAWVANKLMRTLGAGQKLGLLAASIPMLISAYADFKVILGNVDTDALSKENLSLAVLEALKVGAGIFLLSKALGSKFMESMTYSVGATLLMLGATVGVKAVKGMVDTGEITEDNVIATIGGYITEATGIAVLANKLVPGIGWKKAIGTGMALGLLTLTAPIGVKAVKGWIDTGEITMESLMEFLPTALSFGASVGTIVNGVTNNWKKGTMTGIAAGALAITIPLAVKAVKDVVDATEITWSSIVDFIPTAIGFATTVFGFAKGAGLATWKSGSVAVGAGLLALTVPVAIKAVRDVIDTKDITWESISEFIPTAVGFGLSVATVARSFTANGWRTAAAGISAGVLALSVPLAIKTVRDVVDTTEITLDSLQTFVESAVPFAVSAAGFASSAGATGWQSAGAGLVAGSLALLVPIGIKAFRGAIDTSEITESRVKSALTFALSSVGTGITVFSGLSKLTKIGTGRAVAGGIGTTLLTLSALVGVSAVLDSAEAGQITTQSVTEAVVAALGAGAAAGSIALAVGSAPMTALLAGAAVTVATGLAIFGAIKVITSLEPDKDAIHWGDYSATEAEIKTFVEKELFSSKARVALSLATASVTATKEEKKKVEESAADLFVTLNVLKLGINSTDSLLDCITQFNALRENVKSYANSQVTELKTSITLSPVLNQTGEDISAEVLQKSVSGWAEITGAMDKIGDALSTALIDGATNKLKSNWDADYVQELLDKIGAINKAVLGGQMISEATNEFQTGLLGLNGWDQGSVDKALALYEEYQKQLRDGYISIFQQDAVNAESQASYYIGLANAEADPELKAHYEEQVQYFTDLALALRGQVSDRVESAMKENTGSGYNLLQEWFKSVVDPEKTSLILKPMMGSFKTHLYKALQQENTSPYEAINQALLATMKGSHQLSGIAKYAEDLGVSMYELLLPELQQEILSMDLLQGLEVITPEVTNASETIKKIVDETNAAIGTLPTEINGPDTSSLTQTWDSAADSICKDIQDILDAESAISGGFGSGYGAWGGFAPRKKVYPRANGGFVTAGELFLARESGPELVGSMCGRTAVANNDQIVSGIASGVASANAEQNALLRQQNEYLRKLLAKEFTAKAVPSSEWGKFNKRSNEMYARNTGVV